MNNADAQCVPLILNSFGGKDGLGDYQMMEDVILLFSKDVVIPHILEALEKNL